MRLILIFLIILFVSCNSDIKETTDRTSSLSIIDNKKTVDQKFKVKGKPVTLHSEAKKVVENWQEYQSVSEFIPKFKNTSTKEALFNSIQFFELTSQLKDSLKLDFFKTPSLKTRLNVLNNTSLRLFDMDSIPSITNNEVIRETKNIINAYNALNIKINNMVKRDLLTKDLSDFNQLFEKKDSLNIKSIKETINQKKRKLKKRKKELRKKRIKPLHNKK